MKVISLFSGIGGFETAAEWMEWTNVVSCEINEFGNHVLQYYWPNAYHHTDIHTLTGDLINEQAEKRFGENWRAGGVILTGGFPCQPFSLAGQRKGTDDNRYLWPEMLRVIREVQPNYVVAENVFGILNLDGGVVFEQVCVDLETSGYEVQTYVLPACGVNAPHRRDRVWFVAYANGSRCNRTAKYENRAKDCGDGEQPDNTNNYGEVWGATPHANSDGQHGSDSQHEVNASKGRVNAQRNTCESIEHESTPHATGEGLEGRKRWGAEGERFTCNSEEPTSNADGKRLEGERGIIGELERGFRLSGSSSRNMPNTSWHNFPTQSPVRCGNDGLPSELSSIAISKWRREAIKAMGNAIVPQVAFQIFKAIQKPQ